MALGGPGGRLRSSTWGITYSEHSGTDRSHGDLKEATVPKPETLNRKPHYIQAWEAAIGSFCGVSHRVSPPFPSLPPCPRFPCAAQGISIVFGRLSSTHADGSGENAGRRSKIVCCIKSGGTGMQGQCGRRGLKGILYRFVFRCKTWFKTQHPYRKGRNSSACVGFRDIGTEVFFQHSVSGRAKRRAKMCKTTRWRKVDFNLLVQGLT